MVTDTFGSLMEELGKLIKTNLVPDKNNACLIKYPNGLTVQLELDSSKESIIIATELGNVAPGRYRENIFREALKANGLPQIPHGIFAYSQKTENLVLYGDLRLQDLTAPAIADFLVRFLAKANLWRDAMSKGNIPSYTASELSFGQKGGSGMLGLR